MKHELPKAKADLRRLKAWASYRWFIKADKKLVGTISLKEISMLMLYGEIGYMIGEEFHNRGYATAAVRLLVKKIFTESPLFRIQATVAAEHRASIKVLKRAGFKKEGVLRQHFIIQGKRVDMVLFAILKSEWRGGRR